MREHDNAELARILPDVPAETRQALTEWAGRQAYLMALEARVDEINIFATMGMQGMFDSIEDITQHFLGRLHDLGHLVMQAQEPEEPKEPLWTHIEGYGDLRVFGSTDEVVDFLLGLDTERDG